MEKQTLTDISVFNALGMCEFELMDFIKDEDSLVFRAHRGSSNFFWSEIKFLWTGYVTVPMSFFDVRLRMATEDEIAQIGHHMNASQLYCFEDILAGQDETPDRFFIAANSVEITVYYGGEHLDQMIARAMSSSV